jgi:trimethylamine:corrinoid methyltransferase-like protein
MDDGGLSAALDRAERALERVQRALASRPEPSAPAARDEELRAKVREVVEELDVLIREAAA